MYGIFTNIYPENTSSIWDIYPLVNKHTVAIEHGPVEIVDFPIKNRGSFRFVMFKRLPGRVSLHCRYVSGDSTNSGPWPEIAVDSTNMGPPSDVNVGV